MYKIRLRRCILFMIADNTFESSMCVFILAVDSGGYKGKGFIKF